MRIEHLRYFSALADCPSLSQAADRLFMSHQGLSKVLRGMERELGCQLIVRSHEGIALTEAGSAFLPHARATIAAYDEGLAGMQPYRASDAALGEGLTVYATMYALRAFNERLDAYPPDAINEMPLEALVANLPAQPAEPFVACLDLFSHGSAPAQRDDRIGRELLASGRYAFAPAFTAKLGIVVGRQHALASCDSVQVGDVADLPFALIRNEAIEQALRDIFGSRAEPDVVLRTTDDERFVQWVADGKAIGFFDTFLFWKAAAAHAARSDELEFVTLDGAPTSTVGLLYPCTGAAGQRCVPYVEAFLRDFRTDMHGYELSFPDCAAC